MSFPCSSSVHHEHPSRLKRRISIGCVIPRYRAPLWKCTSHRTKSRSASSITGRQRGTTGLECRTLTTFCRIMLRRVSQRAITSLHPSERPVPSVIYLPGFSLGRPSPRTQPRWFAHSDFVLVSFWKVQHPEESFLTLVTFSNYTRKRNLTPSRTGLICVCCVSRFKSGSFPSKAFASNSPLSIALCQ